MPGPWSAAAAAVGDVGERGEPSCAAYEFRTDGSCAKRGRGVVLRDEDGVDEPDELELEDDKDAGPAPGGAEASNDMVIRES